MSEPQDSTTVSIDSASDGLICQREALIDGGAAARFCVEFDGRAIDAFAIAFDGDVHAYVNSCPHRGTTLDWEPGQVFDESGIYLVCATHGALFEADSGRCVGGPCHGAVLTRINITQRDGEVRLQAGSGRLLSSAIPALLSRADHERRD
jgi:nitrite reductase/ring-hydroxylating ferredoxin subunit